jgi:type IX secretion system PorP/SprF family membrane protein
MRKIFTWILVAIVSLLAMPMQAQDYSLSNHNVVPFSLNPSSVGAANTLRLGVNYRMQWPMLSNNYHTVRVSYDQNVYKQMCSVGAAYSYDQMSNVFGVHEFDVVYAHTIKCADKHFIRLGLQGSVISNQLNLNNVTFGDQYDEATGNILSSTVEGFENQNKTFFDFSVGASYVFEHKLMLGFSVYHIAEPDNGFQPNMQRLSRKFVGQATFIQDLKLDHGLKSYGFSENYFFANASYQQQADFKQFHIGAGICYQPVILGVSYKTDIDEVHTASFTIGGYYKGFQLYYVFDLFTSDKKNGSWSNELSLIYTMPAKKKCECPVTYW